MQYMDYFDYESVAREARLTEEELRQLAETVRRDYPSNKMLYELRLLRACRAIRDGVTWSDAIVQATRA